MMTHADKVENVEKQSDSNDDRASLISKDQNSSRPDKRPEVVAQRKLQKIANENLVTQRQLDTNHVNGGGRISFYRFNSVNTDNHVADNRNQAKQDAIARLGSKGKKKVDRTVTTGGAQRNGNYTVYAINESTDAVLVEHDQDNQAILTRYHNWRAATGMGEKDRFITVPHFHAATIPKIPGNNKKDYRENLPEQFPAYDAIGGGHHFYYINLGAPSTPSGVINIPADEINP